jgi:hypothetical protein
MPSLLQLLLVWGQWGWKAAADAIAGATVTLDLVQRGWKAGADAIAGAAVTINLVNGVGRRQQMPLLVQQLLSL